MSCFLKVFLHFGTCHMSTYGQVGTCKESLREQLAEDWREGEKGKFCICFKRRCSRMCVFLFFNSQDFEDFSPTFLERFASTLTGSGDHRLLPVLLGSDLCALLLEPGIKKSFSKKLLK